MTHEFAEEFVQALANLFPAASWFYKHRLAAPIWIRRKEKEKGHPAGGRLEDAAQEVLYRTVKAIMESKKLRERYEKGMSDQDLGNYFFSIMENECLNTCRRLKPLWWEIRDRLENLGTLAMVEKRARLYAPLYMLREDIPPPLDFVELRSRINSVPLLSEPMGERLSKERLEAVVSTIFSHVEAPTPLGVLTDAVLQVFRAKPDDSALIEESAVEELGTETGGMRPAHGIADPAWERSVIERDVASWLRRSLGNLRRDHLLVLKYYTCYNRLSLQETAECTEQVNKILGSRGFKKSTAKNLYDEASRLLRTMPKRRGERVTRSKTSKYQNPFLPDTEEEERAYAELFCAILHEWLEKASCPQDMLDMIGRRVEKEARL